MKKFLKFLGAIILLALVFILVSGLFIAKTFHFERSIVINSSKEEVWKNISKFSNFERWDPWKRYDPNMKRTIEGVDGTPGAIYRWEGNDDVGKGSQEYISLTPMEEIKVDLKFLEPMENHAQVFYRLTQENKGVKVTWGFESRFPYPFNAVCYFFMDMEGMMDKDFSYGLANLKKLCESNTSFTASK